MKTLALCQGFFCGKVGIFCEFCQILWLKSLDSYKLMLYYNYKLVRFTGVPLTSGVWRLIKTNSGLKQNNVPQGWARNSEKTVERPSFTGLFYFTGVVFAPFVNFTVIAREKHIWNLHTTKIVWLGVLRILKIIAVRKTLDFSGLFAT